MDINQLRQQHRDLVTAVNQEEVDEVVAISQQLVQQQSSVTSLIDAFVTAITEGNVEEAESILQQLRTRYEDLREKQKKEVERAMAVRDGSEVALENMVPLQELVQQLTGTSLTRGSFLSKAAMVLLQEKHAQRTSTSGDVDTSEMSATQGELQNIASTLQEQESQLDNQVQQAQSVTQDVTLPPKVRFISLSIGNETIGVNGSTTATGQVSNVGDKRADNVQASITSPDGVSVSTSTHQLGSIPAGESTTFHFSIIGEQEGTYTVRVDVTSANAGSTGDQVNVEVSGESQGARVIPAIAQMNGSADTIEMQDVLTAIGLYNEQNAVPGTDGKTVEMSHVLQIISIFNQGGDITQ